MFQILLGTAPVREACFKWVAGVERDRRVDAIGVCGRFGVGGRWSAERGLRGAKGVVEARCGWRGV